MKRSKEKRQWSIEGITLGEREICELLGVTGVFHGSEYGMKLEALHGKRVTITVTIERVKRQRGGANEG